VNDCLLLLRNGHTVVLVVDRERRRLDVEHRVGIFASPHSYGGTVGRERVLRDDATSHTRVSMVICAWEQPSTELGIDCGSEESPNPD
jgi:hypothetical protein